MRSALEAATEWEGELRIQILPFLLVTDIYGDSYAHDDGDVAVWKAAVATNLLAEADITSPKHEGFIGRWNMPFVRWLKSISIAAQEELAIYYDHERGDTPYEYVSWASSPASIGGPCERFGISSHGGMDEPEWEFDVVRFADGRSEVEERGPCDDPPHYL
ncbi:MAG: hypothetical protein EOP39_11870 [Rubrivivax sp.]|nr:MAG: hypothetical protein EOP39_11870 [Rubrivivax sp.]